MPGPAAFSRLPAPLARLGSGFPAEQPIQADIKRIGNVAKPIQRQVNRRDREIAARVGWQARALRNLLRRKPPCFACIHKAMRELRNVRHFC
jgi:hypothetical protein